MSKYSATRVSLFISILAAFLAAIVFLFLSLAGQASLWSLATIPLFFGFTYLATWYGLNTNFHNLLKPGFSPFQETTNPGLLPDDDESEKSFGLANHEVNRWDKKHVLELERLKDLEKYRKEFVGNVSHELKTPIFNIQGYILTLLEGGIEDPKINKLYLERTEKNIDRMISIVQDLESINKLESGELTLNYEDFDIVKMVEEVFELEHRMAEENKILLEFGSRPDKPIFVRADKKRITEVLTNLVTNAIKYGKKKGSVWVSFYESGNTLMVEVQDNGIGMSKKDLPRVFERFYRVDKSRSREQGGTGLGLSIVKHIIEAHSQTITVKSIPDQGTTFTFTVEKTK